MRRGGGNPGASAAACAVCCKDLDGRFYRADDRFGAWFGVSSAEVVGRTAAEVMPAEAAAASAALDCAALLAGEPREAEIELADPAGNRRRLQVVSVPLFDAAGGGIGLCTVYTQAAGRRPGTGREAAEKADRLAAGVAHGFNNLLTAILINLSLLEKGLADDEMRKFARTAREAAERGAGLIRRLRATSGQQRLAPEVLDCGALLADMAEGLRRRLGDIVELHLAPAGGLWPIEVDRAQLEAVVDELAENARRAMPAGGTLIIEVANNGHDDEAATSGGGRDCVRLTVSDTGCGMTAETCHRAAEPFFTTRGAAGADGLGLGMVCGFVRQSGGQVRIDGRAGGGTAVHLYFPRARPREAPRPSPAVSTGGGETILMVEDDAAVRDVAAYVLTRLGYRVLEAADGRAALAALAREPAIDLLFADVFLPGDISGPALAECVRAERPGLKTLFASGQPECRIAGAAGPARMVPKPYDPESLARHVRRALDGDED